MCLCLVPYKSIFDFRARDNVAYSISQRSSYKALADKIIAEVKYTDSNEIPVVLLVSQGGRPHVPVNQFTYLLWPEYRVPWVCSYGSKPAYEGDTYTQILNEDEFLHFVESLNVRYIAIHTIDDDFVNTYSGLFNNELVNGQVYFVNEYESVFDTTSKH